MTDPRPFDLLRHPLRGISLVEASAGTGKTYSIATLVLRAVVNEGLPIDKILVVTFTRRATDELRSRVRERLAQALAAVEQLPSVGPEEAAGDDETLGRWLRGPLPADAEQRLRIALGSMDQAAIFTVHGFAQRVLQQDALASGVPLEREMLADASELWLRVVQDQWRKLVAGEGDPVAAQIIQRAGSPESLARSLEEVTQHPGARIEPKPQPSVDTEPVARADRLIDALAARWASEWDDLMRVLLNGALYANTYSEPILAKLRAALDAAMSLGGASRLGALAALDTGNKDVLRKLTLDYVALKTKKAHRHAIPAHPLLTAFDEAISALRAAMVVLDDAWYAWLHKLAAQGMTLLRASKRANGVCGYDDLVLDLSDALASPTGDRLARDLRRQYPLALVDEFQDTDPTQWRLLSTIYAEPGQDPDLTRPGRSPDSAEPGFWRSGDLGLVLVGDPKQAIYGFRGADVFAYIAASRRIPRVSMDTNYRSLPAVVEAVNQVFAAPDPFLLPEIDFQPVAAHQDGGDQPGLVFRWLIEPLVRKPEALASAARAAAQEARALVDAGADPGSIAILVRKNDQLDLMAEQLAQHDLVCARLGGSQVFSSDQVDYLTRLLRAVLEPGDRSAFAGALASPLLGWSLPEIAALDANDPGALSRVRYLRETLLKARERWYEGDFGAMAQRLLHNLDIPRRLLARPDGERQLTDLEHLLELLALESAANQLTPELLLTWLGEQSRDPRGAERGDEWRLRLESDADQIQVLTSHAAKGLEFDYVICPFLWDAWSGRHRRVSVLHDPEDDYAVSLWLEREMPESVKQRHALEQRADDLRLLYVTLTRAKRQCVVVWGALKGVEHAALTHLLHRDIGSGGQLNDERMHEQLELLCRRAADSIVLRHEVPEPGARNSQQARRDLRHRELRRTLAVEWRVSSYSALVAGHERAPDPADYDAYDDHRPGSKAENLPAAFAFPAGSRSGVFLHALLENLDFAALDPDSHTIREHLRGALMRFGFAEHWRPGLTGWLHDALNAPLASAGDARFCLADVPTSQRIDEMEFYYPIAGLRARELDRCLTGWDEMPCGEPLQFAPFRGFMRGFIDLVFRHAGRWYLVDYKSNHLGDSWADYAPERLSSVMAEHRYPVQFMLYAVALIRYLRATLEDFDYARDFGGIAYLFLRGMHPARPGNGVFHARPPWSRIERLDRLLGGR